MSKRNEHFLPWPIRFVLWTAFWLSGLGLIFWLLKLWLYPDLPDPLGWNSSRRTWHDDTYN